MSCGATVKDTPTKQIISTTFRDYWFSGKAELSNYELTQARYGELHKGNAILIYVTEPFSISKLVKLDEPSKTTDKIEVLKVNRMKQFNTGVYNYSMENSSFTIINEGRFPELLKTTTTSQEWCGQTFLEVKKKNNQWAISSNSYFESDGNQELLIKPSLYEEAIWSAMKINPHHLPVGSNKMIPSSFFLRLMHQEIKPYEVNMVLEEVNENYKYTLKYPELNRSITWVFGKNFPYQLQSWSETYISGWGEKATKLTTTGKLKNSIQLDYWNKHNNADSTYRELLQIK